MRIYLPVICQNGHKAVASFRFDAAMMDFVFESVPLKEQCKCPKSDFGEGYKTDGLPFIKEEQLPEKECLCGSKDSQYCTFSTAPKNCHLRTKVPYGE